jgi:O-antigen ligase
VLLLPSFRNTELYEQRVADTVNVQGRAVLQDWSLRLAAQKPVFGWGYGSFDQAKNTSGFYAEGVPIRNVLQYTSHDTYLTVLVELGALGILLLVGPFAVLGLQALARSRIATPDRWLNAACLGSLVVVFLTSSTVDFRFFSFAQILPFVFLAILRRTTGTAP